jgi:transcriptional regulator with XRE-family HTH domain
MDSAEALWKENLRRLGEYIKSQRHYHQLSQRDLARLADLSDTYMSQLERGLHEPSIRVLRSLAESLGLRPDQLIMSAAGLPLDDDDISTEDAIRRDPRFTEAQRRALLSVVQSYLDANDAR